MYPKKIYYEPEALEYELGKKLKNMYTNVEWIPIKTVSYTHLTLPTKA